MVIKEWVLERPLRVAKNMVYAIVVTKSGDLEQIFFNKM